MRVIAVVERGSATQGVALRRSLMTHNDGDELGKGTMPSALRSILIAMLAVSALYAAYVVGTRHPVEVAPADHTDDLTPSAQQTAANAAVPPPPPNPKPKPFLRAEWGYRWDPSKPGIAASAEDAAWLESRGFPGPDVEDHLRRLSLEELQALAARGNQPAAAVYAYRLATSGASSEQVLAVLSDSVRTGSVYALKTAGDIYFGVDGFRDPVMARAYYGLQARAGDQAGIEQGYLISNQLDGTQRLQAEMLEERLWRTLGPMDGMDVRPGFEAFVSQPTVP